MGKITRLKLVVVGDGACGKTSLLFVFQKKSFPSNHVPTVFETYVETVKVGTDEIDVTLWDTAGQEDYDKLLPLACSGTDVFLICFSVDRQDSLLNVVEKWGPQMKRYSPGAPIILVGNKADLRETKYQNGGGTPAGGADGDDAAAVDLFVSEEKAMIVKDSIGAILYRECSAMKNDGVVELFEEAAAVGFRHKTATKRMMNCCCIL